MRLLLIMPLVLMGCGNNYHIDNTNKPRYAFGDSVKVISGFFKGCTGKTAQVKYVGWTETGRFPGLLGKTFSEDVFGRNAFRYDIEQVTCSANLSAQRLTDLEEKELVGEYGK